MTEVSTTSGILPAWQRLNAFPGGRYLFNRYLRWFNPYSGSIRGRVVELSAGAAVVELDDRRAVRNHLNSIHAIALTNLGELTSGLALLSRLPADVRGIPTEINIRFHKKARGRLRATSSVELPMHFDEIDHIVRAEIRNADDETVAETRVTWRLSRMP